MAQFSSTPPGFTLPAMLDSPFSSRSDRFSRSSSKSSLNDIPESSPSSGKAGSGKAAQPASPTSLGVPPFAAPNSAPSALTLHIPSASPAVGAGPPSPTNSRKSSSSGLSGPPLQSKKNERRKQSSKVGAGEHDNPDFSGWLSKQGGSGLTIKNWRRRWFVLKDFCLYYYKSPEDSECLGKIVLPSYIISPSIPDDKVSKKYAFKAHHPGMRTFWFAGDNLEHMKQWMTAMSLAAILQSPDELAEESLKSDVSIFGRNFFKNHVSSSASLLSSSDDDFSDRVSTSSHAARSLASEHSHSHSILQVDDGSASRSASPSAADGADSQSSLQQAEGASEASSTTDTALTPVPAQAVATPDTQAAQQRALSGTPGTPALQIHIDFIEENTPLNYSAPPVFTPTSPAPKSVNAFSALPNTEELLAIIAAQQEEIRTLTEERDLFKSVNQKTKQQVAALKSEMFEAFSLLQQDLYEEQQRSQDLQSKNDQLSRHAEKQQPVIAIVECMIKLAKAVGEENRALIHMLDQGGLIDEQSRAALESGPAFLLKQLAGRLEEEQTITSQMEDVQSFLEVQQEDLESKLSAIEDIEMQVAESSDEVRKLRALKRNLEAALHQSAEDKSAQEEMRQELLRVQERLSLEQKRITEASLHNQELEKEVTELKQRLKNVEQLEAQLKAESVAASVMAPMHIDELVVETIEESGDSVQHTMQTFNSSESMDKVSSPVAVSVSPVFSAGDAATPASSAVTPTDPSSLQPSATSMASSPSSTSRPSSELLAEGVSFSHLSLSSSSSSSLSSLPTAVSHSPYSSRRVSIVVRKPSSLSSGARPVSQAHHPAASRKSSIVALSRDSSMNESSADNADSVAERKKILEAEILSLREKLHVLVVAKANFVVQAEQLRREFVGMAPLAEEDVKALRESVELRDAVPTLSLAKRTRVDLEVECLSLRKRLATLESDVSDVSLLVQRLKTQSTYGSGGMAGAGAGARSSVLSISSGNPIAIPQWVKEVTSAEVVLAKQHRMSTFMEDPEKMSFRERLALFL